jgi:hypothetical protein
MKQIILILSLSLSYYLANGQTNFGISMNGHQISLSNLAEKTSTSYGFSGAPHTLKTTYGGGISGVGRTTVHPNFELEYGLGYAYQNAQIHFDFFHGWTFQQIDRTMHIHLHYLEIPTLVNFKLFQPNKSNQLILSGGVKSKVLLSGRDNYNYIKPELISLETGGAYKRFVIDGFVSIGIRQVVKENQYIELNLFTGISLSRFTRGAWGFYEDLSPARVSQLGINLKYFFLPLKKK